MSDKGKDTEDHSTINIRKNEELEFWSEKFEVSKADIIDAVNAIGTTNPDMVEGYLTVWKNT